MPNGLDPLVVVVLLILGSMLIWCYARIQAFERRLSSLEKQHLALVSELEERIYDAPSG